MFIYSIITEKEIYVRFQLMTTLKNYTFHRFVYL